MIDINTAKSRQLPPAAGQTAGQTAGHDPEQPEQLRRVSGKIASMVLEYVREHQIFRGPDLHEHVAAQYSVAPGSADRVLRSLRRDGLVDYRVVNRSASLYQVFKVAE